MVEKAPERVCVTCGTVQPVTGLGCSACGASPFALRPLTRRGEVVTLHPAVLAGKPAPR